MKNFDISWFTTVPGLFITGGVVLLIIALVILIVTGKKSKKEKANGDAGAQVQANPNMTATPGMPNDSMMATTQNVNPVEAMPVGQPGVMPVQNVDPMAGGMVQDIAVNPVPVGMQMPSVTPTEVAPVTTDVSVVDQTMGMSGMPEVAVTPVEVNPAPVEVTPVMPEVMPVEVAPNPVPDINVPTVDPMMGMPAMPEVVVNPAPVQPVEVAPVMPEVIPAEVAPNPVPDVNMPTVEPMIGVPTMPEVVTNPEPVQSVQPVVEPVPMVNEYQSPVDNNALGIQSLGETQVFSPEQTQTVVEATQPVNEPVIYGGSSPAVADINVNPEPHQIYGGADPLQNTQTIPTITPVAPAEPQVVEPVMVTPEVQPVAPQMIGPAMSSVVPPMEGVVVPPQQQ